MRTPFLPLLFVLFLTPVVHAQTEPQPTLRGFGYVGVPIDSGLPFLVRARVSNTAPVEARDVVFTMTIEGITGWKRVDERCVATGAQLRCELGTIAARKSETESTAVSFDVEAIAPDDPSGRTLFIQATVADRAGPTDAQTTSVSMYQPFYVTNVADS